MDSSSFDDSSSHYNIYTGFWINWSRGPVYGATITTPRQDGTISIALLALFVSIVGTHFWNILCFCLHYGNSSSKPQDGLHHQKQAILRNSANGSSGLWNLLMVLNAWGWSGRAARPFRRILPLIVIAMCHIAAFSVAGTFSSKIATAAGDEVLISSPNCGILHGESDSEVSELAAYLNSYKARLMATHAAYAQQCYKNASETAGCRSFIKQNIPTETTRNVACPFDKDMCLSVDGNIRFETGYLDSNDDFGLNTPPEERVQLRRVSTCAPITTKEYRRRGKLFNTNTSYIQYEYGQAVNFWEGNNYTYRYPEITPNWDIPSANTDYILGGMDATVINGTMNNTNTDFVPIAALQQKDADLHLIFLSANSIIFAQEVNDLWFSAHRNVSQIFYSDIGEVEGTLDAIVQDDAASVLACTVKEQYCNPNLPEGNRCAPFGGEYESAALAEHLWTNQKQLDNFRWVDGTIKSYRPSMHNVVYTLGSSALLARQSLTEGIQGALVDNQWQLEAENWHKVSMAAMQGIMREVATGPSDQSVEKWLVKPNNTQEHLLCGNQKIVSGEYFNFSVLGLAITLTVGVLIILLSYTIAPLLACIQHRRRSPYNPYARLEWNANGMLQLQRLAHEEQGVGTWDRCAADVPVTNKGDKLATLDLEDLDHPRLMVKDFGRMDDRKSLFAVHERETLTASDGSDDGIER
ncbi:uncharacterized protein K452DRAFT_277984 [Aplosporella prunicola CBS 121167]|uniref:Uncharacterized protein n=1 Tax=Aplosporella prunicola CBS 121167 TaxID=1176127 RepID=A0A6A6B3I3_9PEZI|nr:uncharacterized protein K452DRAFT_277984 [Aplosporella prunicola CBS 121167]KAF2138168.1 hypothetical protein K452DRAFT_277984 [Aplosporella prunicola CBS 121167]